MKKCIPILSVLLLISCKEQKSPVLTAFKVYCEMVANDAKPIAFHYPMEKNEVDALWTEFESIAQGFDVRLYREEQLPKTLLFPTEATEGKSVVIIYRNDRLEQYLQWKADTNKHSEGDFKTQEALARRLGRLLGYSPQGINTLLRENSEYRDLQSFGVKRQVTHLYYGNLGEAIDFYQNTLGLYLLKFNYFQISGDGYIRLHSFDEGHTADQPKSTAIALLTDQLPKWYAHVQANNVPIKYTYKPKKGGPHDGFVAIDPGGYLLEFEQFKQHPENELLMATLSNSPRIPTKIKELKFYGTITWTYHNDLLKMQKFYEEILGYPKVADQGWTKIYQTASASFIGLVDERRGMEDYADKKAIEIEWRVRDYEPFSKYGSKYWEGFNPENSSFFGPEHYLYRVSPTEN